MKALDLFCCAGGTTRGLQDAGFEVTGVDIDSQPRYCGDKFYQDDAFVWLENKEMLAQFDLIWASPKCQAHSVLTPTKYKNNHEIQLPRVLDLLRNQVVPYIVENVNGTQTMMRNPIMLCGTMFGLDIWRHRWFEIGNIDIFFLLHPCCHLGNPVLISGRGMRGVSKGNKRPIEPSVKTRADAIGIDWMIGSELDQAIPPVYSEFLAKEVLKEMRRNATMAYCHSDRV